MTLTAAMQRKPHPRSSSRPASLRLPLIGYLRNEHSSGPEYNRWSRAAIRQGGSERTAEIEVTPPYRVAVEQPASQVVHAAVAQGKRATAEAGVARCAWRYAAGILFPLPARLREAGGFDELSEMSSRRLGGIT